MMGNKHIQRSQRAATAAAAVFALFAITACGEQGEIVGPRGGSITSDDGRFTLDVPPGALDANIEISIVASPCEQPNAIGDCYIALPEGTQFSFPAEVTFEIADMDLENVDTEDLGVVAERGSGWNVLGDRDVDAEHEVVYASATYLSSFALVPISAQ